MHNRIDRRNFVGVLAAGAGAAGAAHLTASSQAHAAGPVNDTAATAAPIKAEFHYAFNTSTIRGQKLPLAEVVEIAAKAGYQAIEPWIDELDQHVKSGGSLKDLGKHIADLGLTVESAIGFPEWIVDDDARRAKGLEEAKREMDMLAQIGGKRIAAPPAGATDVDNINLLKAAERYRTLLEIGDAQGVVPQVEVWGFSRTLGRLGEATCVAIEAQHPKACVLADVFHLYKGGSNYAGLRLLSADSMHVMHLNDFPANIARKEISDDKRVFPGDGTAPLKEIFRTLRQIGFHGYLSLELFNRDYWRQDPSQVARTGLEKARVMVASSLEI